MSARYPIPAGRCRVEEEIKKSRFITTLDHAATVDDAQALIATVKAEMPDAGHHCYAFLVGPPGTTTTVGMSDDGEPHNTAGRPMLNALVHSGLGDVAAVVSRYWGGTKLGKGGLVRAYSGGVLLALEAVERAEKVEWTTLEVAFDYAAVTGFKRVCPDFEAEIVGEEYGSKALFTLKLPAERADALKAAVTDLTNGRVSFE